MTENQWAIFYDAFKNITKAEKNDYVFKEDERERLIVLAEDIFGLHLSIMEAVNIRTFGDLERQIQTTLNFQSPEPQL
jgi:hypothetical protein